MPSGALSGLLAGATEISILQSAKPASVGGIPVRSNVVRAINRSSVVLLTSHLERYIRALNEESADIVNAAKITGTKLPERLRLQHSRTALEDMFGTQWQQRANQLNDFAEQDSWLWGEGGVGELTADRLLTWMRSPNPKRIDRFFKLWGVVDVFGEITRVPHTRARFWTQLEEMVTRRNLIAHGDPTVGATPSEIVTYLSVVREFCIRVDKAMARNLTRQLGVTRPW